MRFTAVLLAIIGSAHGLSSTSIVHASSTRRMNSPVALEGPNRRQALISAGALFATVAVPASAFADSTEDAVSMP